MNIVLCLLVSFCHSTVFQLQTKTKNKNGKFINQIEIEKMALNRRLPNHFVYFFIFVSLLAVKNEIITMELQKLEAKQPNEKKKIIVCTN